MRIAEDIPPARFKFADDVTLGVDETLLQIERQSNESDLEFSIRINSVIQKALGHVENWEIQPPELYNQRVPLAENLWLNIVGRISSEPQLQRYHFANYRKTLERGIGICGDTSTMLSDILWDNNIPNSIRAYKRHVVVEVQPNNEAPYILDADYGVYFQNSETDEQVKQSLIYQQYHDAGHSESDAKKLSEILLEDFTVYQNTYDFMKKRYILEKLLYAFKWLVPTLLLLAVFAALSMHRKPNLIPNSR